MIECCSSPTAPHSVLLSESLVVQESSGYSAGPFNLTKIRILSDLELFLSTSRSSRSWTLPQESSSYFPYVLHLPLLGYGVQDWGGSHRHGWSLLQFLVSEPIICSGEWGCCSNGVSFILELGPQWLDRAQFLLSKFISEALQFSDSRCKEQVSLLVITHCFMGGHFFPHLT